MDTITPNQRRTINRPQEAVIVSRLPFSIDAAMIHGMSYKEEPEESQATALCKSCGLCCTGHLFVWTKLRSAELNSIQSLGLEVVREPGQRGFSQPCPLWEGHCTIHDSPHYPRFCHTYKCKLLIHVLNENTPFPEAMEIVQKAMGMIREVEALLPASSLESFRERLVAHMEHGDAELEFQMKAKALVSYFEENFGVDDFFDELRDE